MSFLRKVLYSLMVLGGVASTLSAGTFASYTADTRNTGTFATGALVLDRKVGATSCFSIGSDTHTDSNANTSCGVVITQSRVKLGDQFNVDLTLENAGSIAGLLSFYAEDMNGTVSGYPTCTNSANPGASWTGTGDLCAGLRFAIQEYDATFTTATASCAYPADPSAACNVASGGRLSTLPMLGAAQSLATLAADGSVGDARYYRVIFLLPNDAADAVQGRRAQFRLSWRLLST